MDRRIAEADWCKYTGDFKDGNYSCRIWFDDCIYEVVCMDEYTDEKCKGNLSDILQGRDNYEMGRKGYIVIYADYR